MVRILHVEAFRQSRDKYHREFQSLTFVDTHDPDHIGIFIQSIRLSVIHIVFFQLFHVTDKMKQSEITGLLESGCLRKQHLHIRAALAAGGKCRHIIQIIIIVKYPLQQVTDRGERSPVTVVVNTL